MISSELESINDRYPDQCMKEQPLVQIQQRAQREEAKDVSYTHFEAVFVPVGGQRFPELHAVVPADIAVLGGVSQWAA